MKTLNAHYVSHVIDRVNDCHFFKLMSLRLLRLAWGESELTLSAQEKHLQPFGLVHGGVCAALIDAACFWAVHTQLPEHEGMTTVDLKLNYLAPVVGGELNARGRCVKLGRTMGVGVADVYNADGGIVAHGASTVMVLSGLQIQNQSRNIPKYRSP